MEEEDGLSQRVLNDLYGGPGFLAVVWFGSSPHPSSVSKLSLPMCCLSSLLAGEGVRSKIIRRRESLVPLWIIQYSLAGPLPVKEEESLACSLVPLVQVVNQRQLRQLDVVPAERKIKIKVFSCVSDPDWIRFQSGQDPYPDPDSIRSVDTYPDPHSKSGSDTEGQKWPTKVEKN